MKAERTRTPRAAHACVNATASHGFHVGAELTIYHAEKIRPHWLRAWEQGERSFDLSGVTDIDGCGVQLLCALHRLAAREGSSVQLINPSAAVREALRVLGAAALLGAVDAPAFQEHDLA